MTEDGAKEETTLQERIANLEFKGMELIDKREMYEKIYGPGGLRDQLAMAALTGLLTTSATYRDCPAPIVTEWAYELADDALRAREHRYLDRSLGDKTLVFVQATRELVATKKKLEELEKQLEKLSQENLKLRVSAASTVADKIDELKKE